MARSENINYNSSIKNNGASGKKQVIRKITGTVLPLISILLIILTVIGGTFYLLMRYNVNNLADKYRDTLGGYQAFAWVFPDVEDHEDPNKMTPVQLREKYTEIKTENETLKKELEEAKKIIDELNKFKAETDLARSEFDKKQKKLEQDIRDFQSIVAMSNESGFRHYFEEINPDLAAELYAQIVKRQEATEQLKNITKIYEIMEERVAAEIFNEMGNEKIDFIVDILSNMRKEDAAAIMNLMDRKLALLVTENMYKIKED